MQFKQFLYLIPLLFSLSIGCAAIKNKLHIDIDKILGKKKPISIPVVNLKNPKDHSFLQIKEDIVSKGLDFTSLKAKVDITIESPEMKGVFKCKGNLILQKPEKMRMLASKLARTVFDMISDGENFWFHLPMERTVYTGKCNTLRNPNNKVYILPDDIAELLNYDKHFEERSAFMETWPDFWYVHVFDKKGDEFIPYSRLKIDRTESRVTELTLFKGERAIKANATFGDYSIVDNHIIPKTIQINWPETDTTINMALKDITINETLKPEIFQFKKPKRANIVNIY